MPKRPTAKTITERKRSGAQVKRLTAYLDPSLAKELAIQAIREDRSQSDVLGDAVREYLERHPVRK